MTTKQKEPTIKQLQAQIKQLAKDNAVKINQASQIARLKATIALESSPTLLASKVQLNLAGQQTKTLKALVDECKAVVETVPIHNKATRTDREWAGNHRYAFGSQIDLMYELASGIVYAGQVHKDLMLAHTGLDLELLQEFLDAMGSPSYYSNRNGVYVEAKPADLEMAQSILTVLQSELGVVINTNKLNKNTLESEFVRAEIRATATLAQAEEAMSIAQLQL